MSTDTRPQSTTMVIETSETGLQTAQALADISLVLATVDREDEAELRQKMERVQTSLTDAQDSLIADSGEWVGDGPLETETQQVTLDTEIPTLLADLLDVYFEEFGPLVFDNPETKYDAICDELGDLIDHDA